MGLLLMARTMLPPSQRLKVYGYSLGKTCLTALLDWQVEVIDMALESD